VQDNLDAQELLLAAQETLEQQGRDFAKVRRLAQGVGQHLQYTAWTQRLIKDAASRMEGFAVVADVAESVAVLLPEREAAKATARELLDAWGERLEPLLLLHSPAMAPRPLHAGSGPHGEGNPEVTRPLADARIRDFG